MDIRKFFGKVVVQSAPAVAPDVGKPESGQIDTGGSAIARAPYSKKSPFFERKVSPPKRALAEDSSTANVEQNPALKRAKLLTDAVHKGPLPSDEFTGAHKGDHLFRSPQLGQKAPVGGSATGILKPETAHGAAAVPSVHVRSMQGALAACAHKGKERCSIDTSQYDLWTEKHRPRSSADLVGNQQMVFRLREWLSRWESAFSGRRQFGASSKTKGRPSEEPKKAALLCGPPGIGKTSTASIVSRELGFQIIEVNASDARGKADNDVKHGIVGRTSNMIKELVTNQCVDSTFDISAPHKKMVLLMDEVDGMSSGDRGGVQDLIKSIQKSKIPIICICNDKYDRKIQSLLNHCMELHFQKPAKNEVLKRLTGIVRKESLQCDDRALEALLETVQYDIRLAFNELQYRSHGGKLDTRNVFQTQAGATMKDAAMTPFTAADRLLSRAGRAPLSLNEQIDLVFHDSDLVPLIIQENYLNFSPVGEPREDVRMNLIAQAADSLSTGDIVNRTIRQHQRWELMPLACVESAVTCSALVRGVRQPFFPGERNFNRFSGWLGKNSTAGKNSRLLAELQLHLLVSGNCPASRSAVRLDYLQHFSQFLAVPLKEKDKAGVEDVIQFMDEYCLTREDRDAIMEISQVKGFKNILDSIPAQVKATFTRMFNQTSSERVIKSSVMLPEAKGKRSQVPLFPTLPLDTVDGVVTEDNGDETLDEENIEAEGADAVIPGVTKRNASQRQNDAKKNSKRDPPSKTRGRGPNKRGRAR